MANQRKIRDSIRQQVSGNQRPTGEPVPRARETLIRPADRLRQQDWTHQSPGRGRPLRVSPSDTLRERQSL
ncbi:MAG: hypothetical protein F6K28_30640 [Microcoleus sp. SIO2G3]|nr:hypothetical protein [Microcoleus sp. SIO2G3]